LRADASKEQVIVLEIKESLRAIESTIQRAKKELAIGEQELRDYLQEHKKEIDIDIIRFYYWDTSLKTSIASDVLGLKKAASFIGKARKGYGFEYPCCKCGNKFKYYPKLGEVENNILLIKDDRICYKCVSEQQQREYNAKWGISSQESEERQRVYEQRLNALKYMPYPEYLKTEHWKEVSQRARKRANFKCQLCNSSGLLHVHHRTYENRGQENNSDLIVLCEKCHAKFHDKKVVE